MDNKKEILFKTISLAFGTLTALLILFLFIKDIAMLFALLIFAGIIWIAWRIAGKNLWGILLGITICFGVMYYFYEDANKVGQRYRDSLKENAEDQEVAARLNEPVKNISAGHLIGNFSYNAIRAERDYTGRRVKVTGIVNGIDRDVMNNIYILLQDYEGVHAVQCFFDNDKAGEVKGVTKA